ncbi:EAL domain-containing response regulator [Pseudomonas sp. DWP1b1]|uniref:EAL domain-containing response regulator n=1 Tax=unclassified Pseudomonas TaxID=196821 RepID=UPI003CE99D21
MTFALRVLVLEDHAFQRSVAVKMLEHLGCATVFEAADGAQALALLDREGPVDIALCDLQMEGMDGVEFIQRVGASGQVGSIIISSSLSPDLRRAVRQIVSLLGLEFLGDVEKPLQAGALEALLKKQLHARPIAACPPDDAPECATEAQMRRALAEEQLQAYYQPKFNLRSGAVCGVEVLARWQHPTRGIVSPAVFLPALERHGLLDEGLYLQMHQSLAVHEQARCQGSLLNMAFNLSASQLANRELAGNIKQILQSHGVAGSHVTFEITESGLLETPNVSLESLVRLRMMGCRLSIDDFGAGFSSMQRLCQLPFNEIKLDAEFVRNLKHEPRCLAVIGSTLALGEALDMSVVIEGIETAEQHRALLALGCTLGQGYWHARPMSGSDLLGWLHHSAAAVGSRS